MLLIDREQMRADDPELRSRATRARAYMEFQLAATLRRLGCKLSIVAFTSLNRLRKRLDSLQPEVVFNVTEHLNKKRTGDVDIASPLEDYGAAYTGASPLGLLLCRDKAVSKTIALSQALGHPLHRSEAHARRATAARSRHQDPLPHPGPPRLRPHRLPPEPRRSPVFHRSEP
jgi:D-alanine-D-alanine ligase-like ATP-grasp enzyme